MESASVSSSKNFSLFPNRAECSYFPNYCEENVWKLCQYVSRNHPSEISKCSVVFISNPKRMVPLWWQLAGDNQCPLIWDYHVVFFYEPDTRCLVYDLDSKLPFPTYFHKYVTETFRSDSGLEPEYHRYFRVIPALIYLKTFASDRRHMIRPDGSWIKQPPTYPCITSSSGPHNMDSFICMDFTKGPGEVYNLKGLVNRFYRRPKP